MSMCEHGHEPHYLCGLCNIERTNEQYGFWEGEVATELKGRKSSNINYDPEDDCSECDEAFNEEMMQEFILSSFGPVAQKGEDLEEDGE